MYYPLTPSSKAHPLFFNKNFFFKKFALKFLISHRARMSQLESAFYQELKVKYCNLLPQFYELCCSQGSDPFFLMAGPNVIQSEEHIFKMCRQIKQVTDR